MAIGDKKNTRGVLEMRIRTKKRFVKESFDADSNGLIEVEGRLAEGGKRFVVVDTPEGTEHHCWNFDLIKATAKEREELKKRRLIKS